MQLNKAKFLRYWCLLKKTDMMTEGTYQIFIIEVTDGKHQMDMQVVVKPEIQRLNVEVSRI